MLWKFESKLKKSRHKLRFCHSDAKSFQKPDFFFCGGGVGGSTRIWTRSKAEILAIGKFGPFFRARHLDVTVFNHAEQGPPSHINMCNINFNIWTNVMAKKSSRKTQNRENCSHH